MKESPDKSTFFSHNQFLNCNGKVLSLEKPLIMGILNLTPDSFYDGGEFSSEKEILVKIEKMITEGAAIIDIGAVSTRPGAEEVKEEKELSRLIPFIKVIRKHFPDIVISVDTYRSNIAIEAINTGANIINDISGGTFDDRMFEVIKNLGAPYILMHIKGTPQNMQVNPYYNNVVKEVKDFFKGQSEKLAKIGVIKNIVIDPGFGFGKTPEHNFELLRNLNSFHELGYPVMMGISRKSMINKVLKTNPNEALNGTTVMNTIALLNGANILRVHDVKEAVEAVKLVEAYTIRNEI